MSKRIRPMRTEEVFEGVCICGEEFSTSDKEFICLKCKRKLDFSYVSSIITTKESPFRDLPESLKKALKRQEPQRK